MTIEEKILGPINVEQAPTAKRLVPVSVTVEKDNQNIKFLLQDQENNFFFLESTIEAIKTLIESYDKDQAASVAK